MKTILSFFLFCASIVAAGQNPCPDYKRLLGEAEQAVTDKHFPIAIRKFNSAKVCDPSQTKQIDARIIEVFDLVEKQRFESEDNARKARQKEQEARVALQKTETLIGYFGFQQDRACAYKDGKFAVIDRNGKLCTKFEFEEPEPFQKNGKAIALRGSFYYLIDQKGQLSEPYNYFMATNNGRYKVSHDKGYTFLDKAGNRIPGWDWYENIGNFQDGALTVKKDGKWGWVDPNGSILIRPQFQEVEQFEDGVATVKTNEKWGIIDKNGTFLLQPQFKSITFDDRVWWIYNGIHWGLVDKNGAVLLQPQLEGYSSFKDGRARVKKDGKWGLIDENGTFLVQPQFEWFGDFKDGEAFVKKDNKWGLVDKNGAIRIQPQFEWFNEFKDGIAKVQKFGEVLLINKKGELIVTEETPPQVKKEEKR